MKKMSDILENCGISEVKNKSLFTISVLKCSEKVFVPIQISVGCFFFLHICYT